MWSEIKLLHLARGVDVNTPNEGESLDRSHAGYVLHIADLVRYASCPARWVLGENTRPARGYRMTDVTCEILLEPGANSRRFVAEPEVYAATVMVCPGCDSESSSKHCTKCDCDRKPKQVEKPWARLAKPCVRWAEDCARQGRIPVRRPDWELAEGAARAVVSDPDAAALLTSSMGNLTAVGQYCPNRGGDPLWVAQRLDIVPHPGHPLDMALGLVYGTQDGGHHRHSSTAHFRFLHMEAALALDMANACDACENDFREVLQVLVEMESPHIVARRRLAPEFIQRGRELLYETLNAISRSRATGRYATFDPSAPGTLEGWTRLQHDPMLGEGSETADSRFGIASSNALN